MSKIFWSCSTHYKLEVNGCPSIDDNLRNHSVYMVNVSGTLFRSKALLEGSNSSHQYLLSSGFHVGLQIVLHCGPNILNRVKIRRWCLFIFYSEYLRSLSLFCALKLKLRRHNLNIAVRLNVKKNTWFFRWGEKKNCPFPHKNNN